MTDEVKLCVDCKHYRWMSNGAAKCKHPEAVLAVDPVHGGKTELQCDVMRRGSSARCGMEARYFEQREGPSRRPRAKLLGGS